MKSTGIVRKINGLGRIVLPVGVRRMLGIEIGDGVEIYADGGDVILRKHVPGACFAARSATLSTTWASVCAASAWPRRPQPRKGGCAV